MKRFVFAFLFAVIACSTVLSSAPYVSAEEYTCRGSVGRRTLDNVYVPAGARCTLDGTKIEGNIKVDNGARLTAKSVKVNGSIQSQGAASIVVSGGRVNGDIQIDAGKAFKVTGVRVGGSIQAVANSGSSKIESNVVGSDIQVFQHKRGIGVRDNTVDGNLQCKENSPAPRGGGNVVQGSKEDQCRRL